MATTRTHDQLNDRVAALLKNTVDQLGPELVGNPQLGEVLNRYIDQQVQKAAGAANGKTPPTDGGLTDLIGLSPTAPKDLGDAQISVGVADYDDTVVSDRILASGDLYYLYMHERLGVFRVMANCRNSSERVRCAFPTARAPSAFIDSTSTGSCVTGAANGCKPIGAFLDTRSRPVRRRARTFSSMACSAISSSRRLSTGVTSASAK